MENIQKISAIRMKGMALIRRVGSFYLTLIVHLVLAGVHVAGFLHSVVFLANLAPFSLLSHMCVLLSLSRQTQHHRTSSYCCSDSNFP